MGLPFSWSRMARANWTHPRCFGWGKPMPCWHSRDTQPRLCEGAQVCSASPWMATRVCSSWCRCLPLQKYNKCKYLLGQLSKTIISWGGKHTAHVFHCIIYVLLRLHAFFHSCLLVLFLFRLACKHSIFRISINKTQNTIQAIFICW